MHVDRPQCFWENVVWTYETKWKFFDDTVTCRRNKNHVKGPRMDERKTLERCRVSARSPDINTADSHQT